MRRNLLAFGITDEVVKGQVKPKVEAVAKELKLPVIDLYAALSDKPKAQRQKPSLLLLQPVYCVLEVAIRSKTQPELGPGVFGPLNITIAAFPAGLPAPGSVREALTTAWVELTATEALKM